MQRLKTDKNQKDNAQSPKIAAPQNAVVLDDICSPEDATNQPFATLLPDNLQDQVHLIPAQHVALHAIDLPVRSTRQKLAALPFALEDAIAQPLDHTHFAVFEGATKGKTLAASAHVDVIRDAMEQESDTILVPEQMLLSAPEAGSDGTAVWRVYRQDNRVLVRVSDGTGFALHSDMLAPVWRLAETPEIENTGEDLPGDLPFRPAAGAPFAATNEIFASDLRQGQFQPSRGLARPLGWLAASAAFAAFAHIALAAADAQAQRGIADNLRLKASVALAQKLPTASPDDAPALVLRQITARNQPQSGSNFLPMLDSVAQALMTQDTSVQFQQLSWAQDTLRLTVEGANLDDLQKSEAALTASGLTVSSGSATAQNGAARAELTVKK